MPRARPLVTIDARGYFTGGGLGRYTRNLVRELSAAAGRRARLRLLISNQHQPADLGPVPADVDVVVSRAGWMDAAEEDRRLDEEIAGADVFHSLSGHWLPRSRPSVATLHDLTPIVRPRLVSADARRHARRVMAAVERASHVIAVSQATAREARRLFGAALPPTSVVREAADPVFRPSADDGVLARHDLVARGFVLTVSALSPHKNVARLIEAYAISGIAAPLVIAGAHRDATSAVRNAIVRHGLEGRVRLLGRVGDEDLAALYTTCQAFVYPSLYEGFGLPVLEAMACGAAVVASRHSSIPEVAGDAALLVDTARTAALAAALRRIDRDSWLRHTLRRRARRQAAAFSWARTAAATLAVYASVAEARAA